jgi:hypothetical protein
MPADVALEAVLLSASDPVAPHARNRNAKAQAFVFRNRPALTCMIAEFLLRPG